MYLYNFFTGAMVCTFSYITLEVGDPTNTIHTAKYLMLHCGSILCIIAVVCVECKCALDDGAILLSFTP